MPRYLLLFLVTVSRGMSKHSTETDAELDARYEAYFSRADIDGWEVRKVGTNLPSHTFLRFDSGDSILLTDQSLKRQKCAENLTFAIFLFVWLKIKMGKLSKME